MEREHRSPLRPSISQVGGVPEGTMNSNRHVVVGAGPVGTATATLLAEQGHEVVVVTRSGSGPHQPGVQLVAADAADGPTLTQLTDGAAALYNCANPPYHRWPLDWPPLANSLLRAAESSGAVLATVSNLYVYGPVVGVMTEQSPLAAPGVKGGVRRQMWLDALAAHEAGRVRATEVRGSDYILPSDQSAMGSRVLSKLVAGKKVQVLGALDQPHTWTSTEDVARLLVTVAADERGWGRAWHVPSNEPRTQREVVADYARIGGYATPPVSSMSPALLRAVGLFVPLVRELKETAYQRDERFVMDSSAAQQTFGLRPTAWDEILASALSAYLAGAGAAA
jgi:nucleoside-diphosphate-sugar epimerase